MSRFTVEACPASTFYVRVECPTCYVSFWVDSRAYSWFRRMQGEPLNCPKGHPFIRTKADSDYTFSADDNSLDILELKPKPVVRTVVHTKVEREFVKRRTKSNFACPACGKKYKYQSGLDGHQCKFSGVTP